MKIAFFGDMHCGHKYGLLNPDTTLYQTDECGEPAPYKPNPTETQKVAWHEYRSNLDKMVGWAGDDEIIVVHAGDATNGTVHSEGNSTTRIADQIIMAYDCLLPWLEMPNVTHMRLVAGTGAHDFGESSADILLAKMLRDATGKDVQHVEHSLLSIQGVDIDVAHHGPSGGTRPWLHGNSARYYLRGIMEQSIHMGDDPPRIVIRAHYHTYVPETLTVLGYKRWTSDLIVLPSYCGPTKYAQKATKSMPYISFGTIGVDITDGRLTEIRPFVTTYDLRRKETL